MRSWYGSSAAVICWATASCCAERTTHSSLLLTSAGSTGASRSKNVATDSGVTSSEYSSSISQ
ncbi:MAG: hypothetical protein IPL07_20500 [Acidimicrobiaceae bacterium]|nr:hypothetical protein [Acidimicrobiaceae bacterium]